MDTQATAGIPCAFLDMPDSRRNNSCHRLIDVLTLALFGVICGCYGWVEVKDYCRAKLAWLKTFLDLPHGIPSHDTFERLLKMLDLKGAVVTIDAIGTQKQTATQILTAGANYILQVKDNQPTLSSKLAMAMDEAILDHFKGTGHDFFEEANGGHGRVETRKLWVCWDPKELLGNLALEWPGLKALIAVERTREFDGKDGTRKSSLERHYYISSLDRRTMAKRLAACVRGHWSVENNLHWQLDVSFREDERRNRKDHGAENHSRLSRIALNLLKNEKTCKIGIAGKRKKCGWENDYLIKVLAG